VSARDVQGIILRPAIVCLVGAFVTIVGTAFAGTGSGWGTCFLWFFAIGGALACVAGFVGDSGDE
jgi:hypothetical protein